MKRFLLVAMLLISAASVYAADLKITGDAEVRGVIDKAEFGEDTVYGNSFFDADFNFNAALVVTENTTVFTKLTFDSQGIFAGLAGSEANPAEGTSTVADGSAMDINALTASHTYLAVERAYISTKFLPALTVDAGLMGGGTWGTAFGNSETNVTRIKGTYAISEDMKVMAIYEKNLESNGLAATSQNEDVSDMGDTTTYYLAANLKFGAINVLPLVKYQDQGQAAFTSSDKRQTPYLYAIDLAVTGDMGMVGFEFEGVYSNQAKDGDAGSDETKYGVYVDVFAKLDPAKVGVAAFYACATEDGVYNPGSDFDFAYVVEDLSAVNLMLGPVNAVSPLAGMTAFKLYADATFMEKFSAGAAFIYGMPTDKEYAALGDSTFWEVDADFNYLIDAATTWTLEGGYASIDLEGKSDALTQYRVVQKISVKF